MSKREQKTHSRWECSQCDFTYEAPLVGQRVIRHRFVDAGRTVWHTPKRVWQSKYDKLQ